MTNYFERKKEIKTKYQCFGLFTIVSAPSNRRIHQMSNRSMFHTIQTFKLDVRALSRCQHEKTQKIIVVEQPSLI